MKGGYQLTNCGLGMAALGAIAAVERMDWCSKQDVNDPDDGVGIGNMPRLIWRDRRQSAAVPSCVRRTVGSCRMGKDERSVVDPDLRVRGVIGLRVIAASIFPFIPAGNTQAPVMALGWLAADLIFAQAN